MNLSQIQSVYFLGIGGIGMSAIARYFHSIGIPVAGYDRTETTLTRELVQEGIRVHYTDDPEMAQASVGNTSDTLIVLTPAIPKDHKEWEWLRNKGYQILKRSTVLGILSDACRTIGVAGTHGKTTTSTLIAHLLRQSHVNCAAFLGGISTNYHTNLLLHPGTIEMNERWMVVEADEFDRSFLTLHPVTGVITSTDADHLDIYGHHDALRESFRDYAAQVSKTLIIRKGLNLIEELKGRTNARILSYAVNEPADIYADNIRIAGDQYFFDLHWDGQFLDNLFLGIPGLHNVENAVAASASALDAGISTDELRAGLASFAGVKRRFEYIIRTPERIYIDDYAHHPEELRAILSSVRQMYPTKKLTVIFQPHLYSRTRDFASGFAQSLSMADELILMDIYPARELPIEGVNSEMILKQVTAPSSRLSSKKELLNNVLASAPELLLTLGAGDIDQFIDPIKQALQSGSGNHG